MFAGDHGVHAQGVTPWPQEVTAAMVENFRAGGAAVNVLARQAGADVYVVDMGVAADLRTRARTCSTTRSAAGTSDLATGPAMTRDEAVQALAGRRRGRRASWSTTGYDCLLTGDMGIANTTPSAALVAAFTGADPGRGDRSRHRRRRRRRWPARSRWSRRRCVDAARSPPTRSTTLASVGGFEHAGLAGFVLGAAARGVPVVLDGVIAGAAALVAQALAPGGRRATASPGTAASSPGTRSRSTHARAAPAGRPRPAARRGHRGACWPSRSSSRPAPLLREMATFDSAGVARKERPRERRLPAVPLGAAAARAAGCWSSAAATSRSAGSRGCSPPAPTSSWSPRSATPAVEGLAGAGEITWHERGFEPADVDEAWYVIAATDDPAVNDAVSAERRGSAGSSACAPTTRPGPPPGRRRSAGTPASPSRCSATGSPAGPPRSATRSSPALRDGAIAAPHDDDRAPGVVLVGGGPGDPELVTVAARRALSEADVVVADRLAPRELLDELSPDVELVDVAKLPRGRAAAQEEINRVIVDRALAGKRVVRFKGGDSFVFGRGFEEALACAEAGVPWTRDPGLTSAISVPGRGRHPGHPPRRRARVHRDLRAPAARPPRLAGRVGRRSPGCAARSCC